MKAILIGANGMLGVDLHRVLEQRRHEIIPVTHDSLEVCSPDEVAAVVHACRPDVVINTAALHPVEACERDPARAFAVNALAPRSLAQICRESGSIFVHFSSDFVFDGRLGRPHREGDAPCPLNVYGVSKVAGELFVRAIHPRHIIIRTASLFGIAGNRAKGCNFVELMLRKAVAGEAIHVVHDVRMSPTGTLDVAEQLAVVLEQGHFGTFHLCNHGDFTWFEFAKLIFELEHIDADLKPIPHDRAGWGGPRPLYSVLQNNRLQELGIDRMQTAEEALKRYLEQRRAVVDDLAQPPYKGPKPIRVEGDRPV